MFLIKNKIDSSAYNNKALNSWNTTHPIQLYERVLGAADTLSLVRTGKSTSDLVPIQVFHRQMEVVRTVHTGPVWWHADKEIISFLNHKSQQERKQKWKWIWCSLYSWRARHHSEEVFEKQRLWLTSISSRSVASLILNLASSNSWLLELKKPLRVVSMSNR